MVTVSFNDYMKKKKEGASSVAAPASELNQSTSSDMMDFKQYMNQRTGKPLSYVDTPSLAASSAVAPEKKTYTADEILSGWDTSYKEYESHNNALASVMNSLGATSENVWEILPQKHGAKKDTSGQWVFQTQAQVDAYNADVSRLNSMISAYNTSRDTVSAWSAQADQEWSDLEKRKKDAESQIQFWNARILDGSKPASSEPHPGFATFQPLVEKQAREKVVYYQKMIEDVNKQQETMRSFYTPSGEDMSQYLDPKALEAKKEQIRVEAEAKASGLEAGVRNNPDSGYQDLLRTSVAEQVREQAEAQIADLDRAVARERELELYRNAPSQADFEEYVKKGSEDKKNEVAYARANGGRTRMIVDSATDTTPLKRYLDMTQQEFDLYNYLFGKYGADRARTYLDMWQESYNAKKGKANADWIKSVDVPLLGEAADKVVSKALTYGYQAGAGVDSFINNVGGLFTDRELPATTSQFASDELLRDAKGIDRIAQQGFNAVGNMLPSILIGKGAGLVAKGAGVTAGVAAKVGTAATSLSMGTGAAGGAYQQALREGYSRGQAYTYGSLVGASEAALGMLLSGAGAHMGLAEEKLLTKAMSLDTAFKRVLGVATVRLSSEILEEELQLYLEPYIKEIVLGKPYEVPSGAEMMETALVSAFATLLLEGGIVADARFDEATQTLAADVMKYPGALEDLLARGSEFVPNSNTARIATELTKKISDGKNVSETEVKKFVRAYLEEGKTTKTTRQGVDEAQGTKNAAFGATPEQLKAYAEVFRSAKKTMGQRGAAAIAENTDLTKSAPEYFKDFARVYNEGQKGEWSNNPGTLSQEQYTAAFEAGQADAKVRDTDGAVVQVAEKAGIDWEDDYVKGMDQEVAKRIDQLGKDLGVRVRFVDMVRPVKGKNGIVGTADGQYKGNEILVEKNNPNPELFIAGHEFTHRMQDLSPEAYNSFVQAVLADKAYFARGGTGTVEGAITAKIAQYKLKGEILTRETAIDELVADYAGRLLMDETYLDSFMEQHKENRNLVEKLRDLFHEFSLKIKGALGDKAAAAERKLTKLLESSTQSAQEIREGKVQKKTASEGGGIVRFSVKLQSSDLNAYLRAGGRRNIAKQKAIDEGQNIILTNDEEVRQYIIDAISGENLPTVGYARVGNRLAADVKSYSNGKIDITNCYMELVSSDIRHAYHEHLKAKDIGDITLSIDDFLNVVDYIDSYDELVYAIKFGSGNTKIAISKTLSNGHAIIVETVSKSRGAVQFKNMIGVSAAKYQQQYMQKYKRNATNSGGSNSSNNSPHNASVSKSSIHTESGKSNPQNSESKNSLKTDTDLDDEINAIYQRGHAEGLTEEELRDEIDLLVEQRLQEARDKYGVIPAGETPARDVQVPKQTTDNQKVSQTVRTILEAGATPEEIIPDVETLVADGDFSYEKHTDKQAISNAENTIRRVGWAQALSDWMEGTRKGVVSKRNTAMGWALYNNAANSGDVQTAITILDQMVAHQRSAAQALQATRILKKLSPETQLYQVQRSVENLQEELNERFGEKDGPELKVDEKLAEQFMRAKDQEERDAVLKEIYRDIGRQMPSTFRDKWNAWRYLAMLCNARTHVRNIVGNAGFAPVVMVKNLTASAIEEAVYRVSGGRMERSKSFVGLGKSDRDLLSAAWEDYSTVQETAMTGGKYSDFANANRYIEEGRVIFKNRALEKVRKGNSKALDKEDQWFFRPHYAAALAQYCKAHGISPEMLRAANEGRKNTATDGGRAKYSVKGNPYAGKNLSDDPSVYTWNFLTSLPDMKTVTLPEVPSIRDEYGRVDTSKVVTAGMRNARNVGTEQDGKVLVRNTYTGKNLMVTTNSIRHGLNGANNRLLTNARLGAVIGEVVKNAVPINALNDKAADVIGTYAMASYATDSKGREFVAIVTVEQKSGRVAAVEAYDMLHAVSGRQKKSSQADTKSQSINSIKAATISIADLLKIVKETHQSILSGDVLAHFGEERNLNGDYAGKVKFSLAIDEQPVLQTKTSFVDRALLDRARAYAIKEAQKATYRDTNAFSQAISELGRAVRPGSNSVRKGIGVAVEGTLPFRKTPANILVRGLEYSPAVFLKGLFWDVWQIKSGRKSAAEVIDSISAGLTGTGLLSLGFFLAAQGFVRGHGGEDEDENEFEELMGHQAYAMELPDGTSVTLDWLAPEALPFFVGVNLWEQTGGERATLSDWMKAATTVSEPMLEMSCLQSLNDVFDAVWYAKSSGVDGLPAALATMVTSYLTQGLPTLLGQMERSAEDMRMSTYTEKNAFLTSDMQYTIGRASAKLPGWDYQQIPYIDAWGRTESTGTGAERAGNNFLNPAYTSTVETSPMEEELLRLYEQTGEASVFPNRADKYFNVDGKRKDLTAQEYVKYAQAKGQTAYKVLTALTGSEAYRSMSNAEKVEAVDLVYKYANATAKTKVSEYEPEGNVAWVKKAMKVIRETGVKEEQYLLWYLASKKVDPKEKGYTDKNGDSQDFAKSYLIMQMVYNSGKIAVLTEAQRKVLFESLGVKPSVSHHNKRSVEDKLRELKRSAA